MKRPRHTYCEPVYTVVRQIPPGRVSTYGAVAYYLGLSSPRQTGAALRLLVPGDDVPAHRVVNHKGELSGRHSFVPPALMQERLESEGVAVESHRVRDFGQLFWDPSEELL